LSNDSRSKRSVPVRVPESFERSGLSSHPALLAEQWHTSVPSRARRHLHDVAPIAEGLIIVAEAGLVLPRLGLAGRQGTRFLGDLPLRRGGGRGFGVGS